VAPAGKNSYLKILNVYPASSGTLHFRLQSESMSNFFGGDKSRGN